MKKSFYILVFLVSSLTLYSQEYLAATKETIENYEKFKIGHKVRIYMPIIKYNGNDMGTVLEKKDWKYNSKKDLLIIGIVTEKITTKGPNLFFKIKFKKMFHRKKSVSKMLILLEEMSIENIYLLNLQDLKIE